MTYEGAVDLENMEDELQRSAIEDQIATAEGQKTPTGEPKTVGKVNTDKER